MHPVFVLAYPWALYDHESSNGRPRRQVMSEKTIYLQAGHHPMLVAPDTTELSIGGRRRAEQKEGSPFTWDGTPYSLRSIPVGVKPEERELVLTREDFSGTTTLALEGQLARPQRTSGESEARTLPATELEGFLLVLVQRIREAAEPEAGDTDPWETIQRKWISQRADTKDPPMDLIVRHAERFSHLVSDVASRPRRVLSRRREKLSLALVQEIDAKCIDWLVMQPGHSIAERAGPSQRILAVARYEDMNTVENRVLRDFLDRSADAAGLYAKSNRRYRISNRWRSVYTYGRECRRLARELRNLNIAKPALPLTPNYVLQQEPRYRKVWKAYREILNKIEEQDETWRWQRRLWADFCALAVHVSLSWLPGSMPIGSAPLRVANEQARGRWSMVQDQTGLFLFSSGAHPGKDFILSPIAITPGCKHPKIEEWHYSLGASSVVHVEATEGRGEATIVIWAIHAAGGPEEPFEDIVASAEKSLERCLNSLELGRGGRRIARGIVLRSVRDMNTAMSTVETKTICGVSFGPEPGQLADGVECCGDLIAKDIREMFP